MGVSWTEEQQKVIDMRGCDVLVSAAAGSGKTAVLVERIVKKITQGNPPVDIDHLLVVTFTRAAAAEMKDRISARLRQLLEEDPGNENLERQSVLLQRAQISTIDGFCTYVIRNYFHRIDLDPGCRIADEGERTLLMGRVLDELIEEEYAGGSEDFLNFADAYGTAGGRDDRRLNDLIRTVYEYAVSDPDPEGWLDAAVENSSAATEEELENTLWMREIRNEKEKILRDAADLTDRSLADADLSDGPHHYASALLADRALIGNLAACGTYREVYACVGREKEQRKGKLFAPLPGGSKKDREYANPAVLAGVKARREKVKEMVSGLCEDFYALSPEEILEENRHLGKYLRELKRLVLRFADKFSAAKRSRGLVDFSDLEHFALQILLEKDADGRWVRTDAARELAARFDEVMIDEYQDSNLIQEVILSAVSGETDGRYNRFMVGDMKQAIYGFRKARPDLFLEKYRTYREEGDHRRIDLSRNFRSREEVIGTANGCFARLMTPLLGGILYDDRAALHAGASYPASDTAKSELLLISKKDEGVDLGTAQARIEAEAAAVAHRIRELHESMQVADRETGEMRPLQYRDCVVLLRATDGWADTFVRVLRSAGIPAYTASKAGFFSAPEIVTVLNILRICDNPRQDIPFAAVLRSPVCGLSDGELAEIRADGRDADYYGAALQYSTEGRDTACREKLKKFFALLENLRQEARETPIHTFIEDVISRTGYGTYAAAMPAGAQRAANLSMLVERAAAYEKTSYHGLFSFIRYIENLQKVSVDYGEVSLFSEAEDTVRVMTIHHSKGLEFPVVFLSGLGKQFNMNSSKGSVVMHAKLGIGLDIVDTEMRTTKKSLQETVISRAIKRDDLAEEMRVLYVAVTRAKEKLIMTGIAPDDETVLRAEKAATSLTDGGTEPVPYYRLTSARTYLDWILDALSPEMKVDVRRMSGEELVVAEEHRAEDRQSLAERLRLMSRSTGDEETEKTVFDPEIHDFLSRACRWRYPFEAGLQLPVKMTVSDIKMASIDAMQEEKGEELFAPEDEVPVPLVPQFLQGTGESGEDGGSSEDQILRSGAVRGTVYHHVLQCLDFSRTSSAEEITAQIEEMEKNGILRSQEVPLVRPGDILAFAGSSLGSRVREAQKRNTLRREQPFVMEVDAKKIRDDWPEGETILVQGIIDVCFREADGNYILLDYKTDRMRDRSGRELAERYRAQLECYREALERLSGARVTETYLYSFTLGREIRLS